MNKIRKAAFALIGVAALLQVFFDLSVFVLPSMASADGGAIYPRAAVVLGGFVYRCAPYVLFGAALWLARRQAPPWANSVAVASLIGIASPLFVMGIATLANVPAKTFRDGFWPVRPVVQGLSFFFAMGGIALWRRNQMSRRLKNG